MKLNLLSEGSTNAKPKKTGGNAGLLNYTLYLSPADLSGKNLCPNSTPGCRAACLYTAGRGAMNSVHEARLRRSRLFIENREEFLHQLIEDLERVSVRASRASLKPVVRLNGTSDIPWESVKVPGTNVSIIEAFPNIQFYDYTKSFKRAIRSKQDTSWPKNYHLTFSRSETTTDEQLASALRAGVSVAVVFDKPQREFPKQINGDAHDFRFLDPSGVVVTLTAKGRAKKDETGFVVR